MEKSKENERNMLAKRLYVSNSGRGGPPRFRTNRQLSTNPLMHVMCAITGARTWVHEKRWELLIKDGMGSNEQPKDHGCYHFGPRGSVCTECSRPSVGPDA